MRRLSKGISLVFAATPLVGLTLIPQLFARPAQTVPAKAGTATADAEFDRTVRPFLVKNCISCHSDKDRAGGITLEQFKSVASVGQNAKTWEDVIHKVRGGQMPPPGSPRPLAADVKTVTGWLEGELARAEARIQPEAGRVTAHRLNRAEYDNTVHDLLGVDFHPADDFPQDDSGYGFDNIGDVLSLSPPLMEKYLNAAEKVARAALYGPAKLKPSLTELRIPRRDMPPDATIPKEYDETGLTLTKAAHATYRVPVDASYVIRVVLTGTRPAGCEPMQLALWVDGKMVQQVSHDPEHTASFSAEGQPPDLSGQTVTFPKVQLTAGDHWIAVSQLRMYEGLPAMYGGPNPSKRPTPKPRVPGFFRPPADATPEQLAQFKARQEEFLKRQQEQVKFLPNAYRLSVLEIGGPYDQITQPSLASKRAIYTCGHLEGHHTPDCGRKIIANLARRAFRRPVSDAEVDRYVRLLTETQKAGDSFEEGLCVAIQGILVSPNFLYRIEQDPSPAKIADSKPVAGGPRLSAPPNANPVTHPLTPHELASRLSYFLWSSMPDDELLRCADKGTLREPTVLEHQVRRMLLDPKAHAFTENFAGQWLELRKLESLKPNLNRFMLFDDYLRLSMRQETEHFFENIVRQDRSVLEFIDADYTFLNERLARFYDIPGVVGPGFRRVSLAGSERGGILTQASILTVSSYATRTSPVLRGKWILENLLNTPPPPPPPNIPALEETKVAPGATLRQQLEQHRANPLCASCHSRMDPLGFALENFDAIGSLRLLEGKTPIDASGKLPDGRAFQGPTELKRVLLKDKDAFTRCLTEKMLTYALGRGLESYDRPTVKAIAARAAKNEYRFSSLVLGIAESLPFQQRKGTTL